MKSLAICGLLLLSLVGCSTFTRPMEQPVIKEKLGPKWTGSADVGTLSLTPDRRVVLESFTNGRFCAEAPTEVGTNLNSQLQAVASAQLPSAVQAQIGVAVVNASNNQVLNPRSQGMQLFLANSYFVCQMYMNKAIDENTLITLQMAVFNASYKLIEEEIPYLHPAVTTTSTTSPSSNSATSAGATTMPSAVTTTTTPTSTTTTVKPTNSSSLSSPSASSAPSSAKPDQGKNGASSSVAQSQGGPGGDVSPNSSPAATNQSSATTVTATTPSPPALPQVKQLPDAINVQSLLNTITSANAAKSAASNESNTTTSSSGSSGSQPQ